MQTRKGLRHTLSLLFRLTHPQKNLGEGRSGLRGVREDRLLTKNIQQSWLCVAAANLQPEIALPHPAAQGAASREGRASWAEMGLY